MLKRLKIIFMNLFFRTRKTFKRNRTIYQDSKELTRLEVWWSVKCHGLTLCRSYFSGKAVRTYGFESGGASCAIIGYIEYLEGKIKECSSEPPQ